MAATLHVLRPQTPPVAGFLRIGHTGHRKLLDLQAAGRLPFRRFVFDAAHLEEQIELVKRLKAAGCEIVLDPNFAEMATVGRFGSSSLQKLPWANLDRPWSPEDFTSRRNQDAARAIAEFAIKAGVDAVLAPTHLIEKATDAWRRIDLRLCEALRHELDQCGGADVTVDYQLITTSALLKDVTYRASVVADVACMPVENVWLRASGFGATATGAGTRHFIESARGVLEVGRPLVVDMAGGFAGLGAVAFGAIGGISHGVGQKESFKAADWRKPPSGGGGASARAYVHELDRYFKDNQLQALFGAKGGRSRFGCNDTKCCPHGGEDMIESSHAHFLTQRHRQLDDLSAVPEARRAEHFLLRHLDPAIRSARHAARLKIADEQVMAAVGDAKVRLVRLRDALADLNETGAADTRSRAVGFRGGAKAVSAVLGR
ncbi:MAG TPA: hypothetical protein VHY34_12785 [Caulobacteraceae bacterium]|jgi:hypothetical protein|nr:hypothetical protein [Caulobacteraceae bacterium]